MSTFDVLERGAPRFPWVATDGHVTKRLVDVVLGILLCVLATPLILTLILVLAVQHRTVPIFVHDRIGRFGRSVPIPKLRTLARATHPYADKTCTALEPSSRFAATLRRTHLDELPQLYLVPIGKLSLVGPRPRMLAEANDVPDEEFAALRTTVPQGCTGLWQISEDKVRRVSDHPEYDRFYVAHRTARLDLWILWRTGVQAMGARPVGLGDVPRWALRKSPAALVEAA